MEDLIPLIIVIAISIIGAVTRKKKPMNQDGIHTPNQRDHQNDDLLGWLEKLNIREDEEPFFEEDHSPEMVHSEVPQRKSVLVEEPVKNEVKPNVFSQYSGFISPEERENLMKREGISTVKKKVVMEGDLTQQTIKDSEIIEKKPKFEIDLRKAVIYSEILNRKYI